MAFQRPHLRGTIDRLYPTDPKRAKWYQSGDCSACIMQAETCANKNMHANVVGGRHIHLLSIPGYPFTSEQLDAIRRYIE